MSLRSRIHGFTAWVNLRLKRHEVLLSNVLVELLTGTYMKELVESITGKEFQQLQSFDNLTQQQRTTRAEWILEELKKCQIVPKDATINCQLLGAKSPDQLFDFLWLLVCHDVWFVWERSDFLMLNDLETLCKHEFNWIPKLQLASQTRKRYKETSNLLAGFGSASKAYEEIPPDPNDSAEPAKSQDDLFPGAYFMKSYKNHSVRNYPKATDCILEMLQSHMRRAPEGHNLTILALEDMADVRALCALINSFVPHAVTSEVLLNDRWSINLVLRALERMFRTNTAMDSEDLAGGDRRALASFFCFVFMAGYQFRQCHGVTRRIQQLDEVNRQCKLQLYRLDNARSSEENKADSTSAYEMDKHNQLQDIIKRNEVDKATLNERFDLAKCAEWVAHVNQVLEDLHLQVREKMNQRFELVRVPRNITISDLCLSLIINLSFTGGTAFYQLKGKEIISENRKIVLHNNISDTFLDDFNPCKRKVPVRKILGVGLSDFVELSGDGCANYDVFLEAQSKNKQLTADTLLLYQVFPGSTLMWQKALLKAAKDGNLYTIKNLISCFKFQSGFINCRERDSGCTPLHLAARAGHFNVVRTLLENYALMNVRNHSRATPLFSAIEGNQREVCHLLIEWGCDVHCRDVRDTTAFDSCRNFDLKAYMLRQYDFYSERVPAIVAGDQNLLSQMIQDHRLGIRPLCSLRSRCINGSTLLHTAAYFGDIETVLDLIELHVDVNLCDYKGAKPLHRANDIVAIKVLLEAGAAIGSQDNDGNQPLHVKCYGEANSPAKIDAINLLLDQGASLVARNHRLLMPVHCAAMQGRHDVIELLLKRDTQGEIRQMLAAESGNRPPSLVHLALANGSTECADWLMESNFVIKPGEANDMLRKIVTAEINLIKRNEVRVMFFS